MSSLTKECLFCNKKKQNIIYSTKFIYVVRDSFPVTKYHSLIIPHRHISNFFDLNKDELKDLSETLKKFHLWQQKGQKLSICQKFRLRGLSFCPKFIKSPVIRGSNVDIRLL